MTDWHRNHTRRRSTRRMLQTRGMFRAARPCCSWCTRAGPGTTCSLTGDLQNEKFILEFSLYNDLTNMLLCRWSHVVTVTHSKILKGQDPMNPTKLSGGGGGGGELLQIVEVVLLLECSLVMLLRSFVDLWRWCHLFECSLFWPCFFIHLLICGCGATCRFRARCNEHRSFMWTGT